MSKQFPLKLNEIIYDYFYHSRKRHIPIFVDSISIPSYPIPQNQMYLISQDSLSPDCRVEKRKKIENVSPVLPITINSSSELKARRSWKGSFREERIDPILKRSPCLQVRNPLARSDLSIPLLPFQTSNDGGFALVGDFETTGCS